MLEVQASNDPAFKTYQVLAERTELPWYNNDTKTHATNLWEQFINDPKGYRYLRVKSTDPHGKLSMGEFEVFGFSVK